MDRFGQGPGEGQLRVKVAAEGGAAIGRIFRVPEEGGDDRDREVGHGALERTGVAPGRQELEKQADIRRKPFLGKVVSRQPVVLIDHDGVTFDDLQEAVENGLLEVIARGQPVGVVPGDIFALGVGRVGEKNEVGGNEESLRFRQ